MLPNPVPKLKLLVFPVQARSCLQKLREDMSSKLDRDPRESPHRQEIQVIANGPWWGCARQSHLPVTPWVPSLTPLPGKERMWAMLASLCTHSLGKALHQGGIGIYTSQPMFPKIGFIEIKLLLRCWQNLLSIRIL